MRIVHPNIIRQFFILFTIIGFGIIIFREITPYLTGLLGAVTLYILLYKPMQKLEGYGWPSPICALFLILISFFLILVPISGIALMFSRKIQTVFGSSDNMSEKLRDSLNDLEQYLGVKLLDKIQETSIIDWLSSNLSSLLGSTIETMISIGIMYFVLYYMLNNRKKLRSALFNYIPMADSSLKLIEQESKAMVRANALGIPLVALTQAVVALIGFLIFNIEEPVFWAVIVFIGSMIPIIGTLLGILPVFFISWTNGDSYQAWGILLYGLIVVGSTDNLIRLFVIKKLDNVHPLITLIGVLIGLPLFGFIGLIFGPLLVSIFLAIIKIYKNEFGKETEGDEAKL
ncbi:AI-2E family transporter [Ascidiimonas aurantiaca]|uniref:AI-2E family transporter n=1 Tax=Ascidiimonas aurantiaca TaxID=1685432 RepID=UPI0030EEAFDC